jgi:putative oxidoreductase
MKTLNKLTRTDSSHVLLLQRTALGLVVAAHGAQKLFGWFGGWGLDATVRWFADALQLPAPVALFVIVSDVLGSLALAAGAFTRIAALATSLVMLGAIATVHAPNGFFMNWSGSQAGEGFEFHLLALALSLPLIFKGAGAWSVDGWLSRRASTPSPTAAARSLLPQT